MYIQLNNALYGTTWVFPVTAFYTYRQGTRARSLVLLNNEELVVGFGVCSLSVDHHELAVACKTIGIYEILALYFSLRLVQYRLDSRGIPGLTGHF